MKNSSFTQNANTAFPSIMQRLCRFGSVLIGAETTVSVDTRQTFAVESCKFTQILFPVARRKRAARYSHLSLRKTVRFRPCVPLYSRNACTYNSVTTSRGCVLGKYLPVNQLSPSKPQRNLGEAGEMERVNPFALFFVLSRETWFRSRSRHRNFLFFIALAHFASTKSRRVTKSSRWNRRQSCPNVTLQHLAE